MSYKMEEHEIKNRVQAVCNLLGGRESLSSNDLKTQAAALLSLAEKLERKGL